MAYRFSVFLYIVQTSSMLFPPKRRKKRKEKKKKVLCCLKFPGFTYFFLFALE